MKFTSDYLSIRNSGCYSLPYCVDKLPLLQTASHTIIVIRRPNFIPDFIWVM